MSHDHFANDPLGSGPQNEPPQGGVNDETVASPALGYGMERLDFYDSRDQDPSPAPSTQPQRIVPPSVEDPYDPPETLGRNEVAAVSVNRDYYAAHKSSPYLTQRQARQDVFETRKRRSTVATTAVILIIVAVIGAAGWFFWNMTHQNVPRQTVKYDTREIEYGEFLESINSTSLVQPINECAVTPNVSGTIAEVFVEDGATVEEGAQLFRLDNPTITDAVTRAQEALSALQSDVDSKSQAVTKADEELGKAQEAVDKLNKEIDEKSQDSNKDENEDEDKDEDEHKDDEEATEDEENNKEDEEADSEEVEKLKEELKKATEALDASKAASEHAHADLDAAHASLGNIQNTYDRALEQQATLTVVAPISGKVTEMASSATPSSSVSGATQLCTISDTSRYRVQIEIPKESAERVNIGQETRIAFPAIEDLAVTSGVASIDPNGESLLATVILENNDERLAAGIAAEVCIVLQSIPDSLMVPLETVQTDQDGNTHLDVLLDASRNIVTKVPITIVATNGTHAAVKADNIQKGNTVIVPAVPNKTDEQ